MCEKTKKQIDVATLLYKIFLLTMITSQLFALFFMVMPLYAMVIHIILSLYLLFRYYMLVRMKNRAIALDLTLTEFLIERDTRCKCCKKCSKT
jgi:hypothetical protein